MDYHIQISFSLAFSSITVEMISDKFSGLDWDSVELPKFALAVASGL